MDPSTPVLDPGFEVRLVVMPRYAIHAGGGFALKRVKRRPERVDIDVVEERGELPTWPSLARGDQLELDWTSSWGYSP